MYHDFWVEHGEPGVLIDVETLSIISSYGWPIRWGFLEERKDITAYVSSGPPCVPLHNEFIISPGVFVVCDDPLGVWIAHENGKLGLIEYLADTYEERHISLACMQISVQFRDQIYLYLFPSMC